MIFFVMMGDLKALIAQLDRVQVSEACGVGSSPAERTIYHSHKFPRIPISIENKRFLL